MSAPTVDGLMKYTTAIKLIDIISWLHQSDPYAGEDILKHDTQKSFVGSSNLKFMTKLADLPTLMDGFSVLADDLGHISRTCAAMAILQNIAQVAFSVHVMLKGFIEIPDNYQDLAKADQGASSADHEVISKALSE
ncbi:hypothetical protein BJ165DRAFT_663154 [Panaeolus papilionaceus]|nr:hypothetical protein BJ165DRAFT_663154 [Panaeolus papilionaceus]